VKRICEAPSLVIVLLLMAGILAGCGAAGGESDEMDGMEHENMEQAGETGAGHSSEAIQVELTPAPEGPGGEYLTVMLTDADGAPITDATVSLEGNMNHAGMVPVITDGVTDEADGAEDGAYQAPFGFTMNGDWIITISAEMPDGSVEQQDVNLTVTDEAVEVQ